MSDIAELFPDRRGEADTDLRNSQLILLRVLRIVDYLCKKNEIRYWIDGGTLLGAVRHDGFIPWDDDIDLCMPRDDYNRFLQIAPTQLPEDLYLQTLVTDPDQDRYDVPCKIYDRYSRIEMTVKHGCAGEELGVYVDIMPMDRFYRHGAGAVIDLLCKLTYRRLCGLHQGVPAKGGLRIRLQNLLIRCRPLIPHRALIGTFRVLALRRAEKQNRKLAGGGLVGYGFDAYWLRLFRYDDIYPLGEMSFEGYRFPVPNHVDPVLRTFYGDYTIPKKYLSHHEVVSLDVRRGERWHGGKHLHDCEPIVRDGDCHGAESG